MRLNKIAAFVLTLAAVVFVCLPGYSPFHVLGRLAVPGALCPLAITKRFVHGELRVYAYSQEIVLCVGRTDFMAIETLQNLAPGDQIELSAFGYEGGAVETRILGCAFDSELGLVCLGLENNRAARDFLVDRQALRNAGFDCPICFNSWRVR